MGRTGGLIRFLDRYVLPPFLFSLSVFRIKRPIPRSLRRVLFIKSAAIGDTVLISAVVEDFRRSFPGCSIVFVTGHDNAPLAGMIDGVDRVVPVNHKDPVGAFRTVRGLGEFDLAIDFGSWPRFDALLTLSSKGKCRIGFRTPSQYRHYCYDITVPHSGTLHELDNYRCLIKQVGVTTGAEPSIGLDKEPEKGDVVVFHPFSGGRLAAKKEWRDDNWVKLASMLGNCDIVITGAAKDARRAEELAKLCGGRAFTGNSLEDTARLLVCSKLVISVNTGIMHLAAALGCRVVDICGPVRPDRWGGCGNVISLASGKPVISLGFEDVKGFPMEEITPERVYEAIKRLSDG
ncbi:glycosyltransferase family 9 protein [Limisalsivibrio acetivorans]|uniref:glycosyltransferase family 9 protein n=1 Tax=Limisalsivibrio acetivorans TaxID=1304888 RepID=UPI0003B6D83B|nr:glycosyltransferase family 9 protein [Limisalsivibrio acetivorans]